MILLFCYIILLFVHLFLFWRVCRKPSRGRFILLYSAELLSCAVSGFAAIYFNRLPGYGFMPGLTYFGEVIFSLSAFCVFCFILMLSLVGGILIVRRTKK